MLTLAMPALAPSARRAPIRYASARAARAWLLLVLLVGALVLAAYLDYGAPAAAEPSAAPAHLLAPAAPFP